MFDHLVKANKLDEVMRQHGLVLPDDLNFIKEQINGPLKSNMGQAVNIRGCGWTESATASFYVSPPAQFSCLVHSFLKSGFCFVTLRHVFGFVLVMSIYFLELNIGS